MNQTNAGHALLREFYSGGLVDLTIPKAGRDRLWKHFSRFGVALESEDGFTRVKTIHQEIVNAMQLRGSLQRSVFSECVFTFDLAEKLGLFDMADVDLDANQIPKKVTQNLDEISMKARYIFSNEDKTRFLVQAGGPNSVDALLVDLQNGTNTKIEFKEAAAKTSEPDLEYDESGFVQKSQKIEDIYPQFVPMLEEAIAQSVNVFELANSNTKNFVNFTDESITWALDGNFAGNRAADVICTEDRAGRLVMMLPQDIKKFVDSSKNGKSAGIKGEIRSAGKNHYEVWSKLELAKAIEKLGGAITDETVANVPVGKLLSSNASGNESLVSRLKISSIFFIRPDDVVFGHQYASFKLTDVRQIRATISAHMFFRKLDVSSVMEHYKSIG